MSVNVLDSQIDVFQPDSSNSNSLTNYYPMNETQGTTGNDVEGNANLTLKSGVTVNFGNFDNLPTYDFDGGSNSYAAIQNKNFSSSGGISELTVGAWIKPEDTGVDKVVIGFDDSNYFRLNVTSNENAQFTTVESDGTTDTLTGTTDLHQDANFHFIAGVYDQNAGTQKRLHVDDTTEKSNSPHPGSGLGTGTTRYGFVGDDSQASSEDGTNSGLLYDGQMAVVFIFERALSESELTDIYNAGVEIIPPDFTIPSSDITSLDVSQRLDKRRDSGRIVIENNDGSYDTDSNEIDPGDILRFRTQLEGETELSQQWTAMAETILYEERDANRADVRIEATDFVFGAISNRITENSYEGISIVDIVNDTLSGEVPEIRRDRVQNITKPVDAFPRGTNVLDFLNEMAGKADSYLANRDRSLVFEKAQEAPFAFNLTASDRGPHIVRKEGSSITNRVRVDGGKHSAIDDQQTTQSSTTTVTQSSRITHQLSTRKSKILKILLYTSKTGSGEGVRIRIQKDDGGSPVAVGDSDSDMMSTLVPAEDLTDGGLTTFFMPDNIIFEPDPWMIIESDGDTGQDIGVDGSGNPRYDAYFEILLLTVSNDTDSENQYRTREKRIFRDNLPTRDAAQELGQSEVRHGKEPDEFIEFPAESVRAHNLKTGDKISVNETNTDGDFIVTEKNAVYNGLKLNTTISSQKISTV